MYPNFKLQLWRTGMRQNRLAQMLGVDETALSRIVNGYREPGEALRRAIADLIQSDEEWLFTPIARQSSPEESAGPVVMTQPEV